MSLKKVFDEHGQPIDLRDVPTGHLQAHVREAIDMLRIQCIDNPAVPAPVQHALPSAEQRGRGVHQCALCRAP